MADVLPSGRDCGAAAGLPRAYRTLLRGVDYLERHRAVDGDDANLTPSWLRARVVGNHLRELDAFLAAMLDMALLDLGAGVLERRHFGQRRNTHAKLRDLLDRLPGPPDDDDRLLCLTGPLRSCLHARGGRIAATDRVPLRRSARHFDVGVGGDRVAVPRAALLSICALYRAAGDRIVLAVDRVSPDAVDLIGLRHEARCANVACDGF